MLEILGWIILALVVFLAIMFVGAGLGALIGNAWVGISRLVKRKAP